MLEKMEIQGVGKQGRPRYRLIPKTGEPLAPARRDGEKRDGDPPEPQPLQKPENQSAYETTGLGVGSPEG